MSQTPSNIGRYEVMNPIGQGGMGSLFLAWDPKLERKIAIKLLRDDDESLRERFSREARAAARLRHPNIVTIFDVGDHDGQPFIAMEYIQGHTLAEMIHRKTAMPLTRKLELMEALCDGLGFAHKAGIIHRDIKPANLMVDAEGALKILDFGIARASESSGMTQAGMLIGTLNYMSPEQVSGATVDARSDIFAVGAVCYELVAGKQAFPGGLLAGILNRIMTAQFEPLADAAPDVDPEAVRIITKALARDPADRYQDLQTMRKELLFLRMRYETQSGLEVAAPASESPTIVVPTPVPVRRTGDREELERRRAAQIEAHLAEARQKFAAREFEDAVVACEQALILDADQPEANDLHERARTALEAVQREQQEAQRRAAAIADLVARAQQAYDKASFVDAISLADQALALDSESADARAVRARAEQGRESEERAAAEARAAAERRARAERIGKGVAAARALVVEAKFGEAVAALRAIERAEGSAPEIAAALRETEAREREAERLARMAREAAAHVEAATDLLGRGELPAALARAAAALSVDPQHEQARALRGRIENAIREDAERKRAEEAKHRAEEAAARQREKASAAAIKQARKAKSIEAAIAVLAEALKADPEHPELRLLLESKQAEQARAAAAEQERQRRAAEAERQRQAEAEQRRQAEEAEKKRRAAEAERQRQAEAEQRRQAEEAEKKRRAAEPERQRRAAEQVAREREKTAPLPIPDDRTVVLRPGMPPPPTPPAAAAAPVKAAAASSAPAAPSGTAHPQAAQAPAFDLAQFARQPMVRVGAAAAVVLLLVIGYFAFSGPDTPAPIDQTAVNDTAGTTSAPPPEPPPTDPAPPTGSATPPPPDSTPADNAAAAEAARREELNRQLANALRTARQQVEAGDRDGALATAEAGLKLRPNHQELVNVIGQLTSGARDGALAAKTAADAFGAHATGLQAYRDAGAQLAEGDRLSGSRQLPGAARAFWEAERLFARAAEEGKAAKAAADREAERKRAEAEAATAAPPVKPDPPPPPPVNPDEAAVRELMQRYADAYTRSDARAVAAIHPALVPRALQRGFNQLSGQRMELQDVRITFMTPVRARVQCTVVHNLRPKAGAEDTITRAAIFLLEKRNGSWFIVARK